MHPVTDRQRWRRMTKRQRQAARMKLDWCHAKSQLTLADMDEQYDELILREGIQLTKAQMLSLVLESAHVTSEKIMAIHRAIWFNYKGD